MHEMSIVLNIFDIIKTKLMSEYGENHGKIKNVTIIVGKLSSVVPEALEFSFDIAKQDSIFQDAALKIIEVSIEGECKECKATFAIEETLFICPKCKNPDITIKKGRELFIESIEIENE